MDDRTRKVSIEGGEVELGWRNGRWVVSAPELGKAGTPELAAAIDAVRAAFRADGVRVSFGEPALTRPWNPDGTGRVATADIEVVFPAAAAPAEG